MTVDCTAIREIISRSLDGEAAGGEQTKMEEHLNACGECHKYHEIQRLFQEKVRDVPLAAPGEIEERLRKIHPAREREAFWGWIFSPSLKPVLAGICGLVLISAIVFLSNKERMKTLYLASNDEQVIQTLSEEERELLFFLEENNGEGEEDYLQMLEDLDEMEKLFTDGRTET